jgi:hypothetical protein
MDAERSPRRLSEHLFHDGSKRRSTLSRLHWLLVAVALCWLSWPAPAEAAPACSHDLCEVGGNLNQTCERFPGDTCVDDICGPPNDDIYCCTVEWDDNCIEQVLSVCGDPVCAQICDHNPCEVGGALDSTCNACTAEVCFLDPSCCTDDGDPLTDDWDASCVDKVEQQCGYQCALGSDQCSTATPIHAGWVSGTLVGATNDGCTSDEGGRSAGCRSPDVWYEYTQGEADDMVLSTCSTQRSYAIDTVLSVHAGETVQDRCPGKANNQIIGNDDWDLGLTQACELFGDPKNVDSAVPLGGSYALAPGETVVIRVAHHDDSTVNNFTLNVLPEPQAWLALVVGAGALSALSRRRARGQ